MNAKSIEALACDLANAKTDEAKAKSRRIMLEEEIAARVDSPENGSKTFPAGNGLKITIKRGWLYKADVDAIRGMDIADEVSPIKLIPAQEVFDSKEYERIIKDHPDIAAKLAQHVTVTPAKVSVTLKVG